MSKKAKSEVTDNSADTVMDGVLSENQAKLNHETDRMGPRSAVVLANTPPNSQLLSLFGDLFYAD